MFVLLLLLVVWLALSAISAVVIGFFVVIEGHLPRQRKWMAAARTAEPGPDFALRAPPTHI